MKEARIKKKYETMANEITPKSKIFQDCLKAFLVGGIICDVGQLIHNIYIFWFFRRKSYEYCSYNNDIYRCIINWNRHI